MTNDIYKDIKIKLEYSFERLKYLQGEISKAQREDASIEHLGIIAGEILSHCRECFDYAMEDARSKLSGSFLKTRKIYFPFNRDSLRRLSVDKNSSEGQRIYEFLGSLVEKIESQEDIPETMTDYGILLTANKLVNEKKHSSLLKTYDLPDRSVLFSCPIGSMQFTGFLVYDKKKHCLVPDGPPMEFTVSKGASTKLIKGFLFSYNDADLAGFIINYIRATQKVLSNFYTELLGGEPIKLASDVTPKPMTKEKREAFDKIFPIFCRPITIAVRSGTSNLLVYRFDISGGFIEAQGEVKSLLPSNVHETIARYLRFMSFRHLQGKAMGDMRKKIDAEWSEIKSYDSKALRYFELHVGKTGHFSILSNDTYLVKNADSFVVGFGMHFKTEDSQSEVLDNGTETDRFWEAIRNGIRSEIQFCHSGDGRLKKINVVTEKEPPSRKVYWAVGPTIKISKDKNG